MKTILPQEKNPSLRKKAASIPIADIKSRRVKELIRDMKALLSKEEFGVALAAPQVGEEVRLFIVSGKALARGSRSAPDSSKSEAIGDESQSFRAPDEPIRETQGKPNKKAENVPPFPDQIYINPELIKISRAKKEKHEGCLSVRGKWGTVPRAEKATVRAYDEKGKRFTRGASGFLAHVFQHEMDHLEGILYTDKATAVYEDSQEK